MVVFIYLYTMKVISTNIGEANTIVWQGTSEQTGIYKYPTANPIFLGSETVDKDTITDRKHHGGIYKACYLYSADYYPYWKLKYPHLSWDWGMFGENITVEGLDETTLHIGSVFSLGEALVEITVPREPCYKLGIRFESQKVIQEFIAHEHPGTYVRILKEGNVAKGASFTLVKKAPVDLTTVDFYRMLFMQDKDQQILEMALKNDAIPPDKRKKLMRFLT